MSRHEKSIPGNRHFLGEEGTVSRERPSQHRPSRVLSRSGTPRYVLSNAAVLPPPRDRIAALIPQPYVNTICDHAKPGVKVAMGYRFLMDDLAKALSRFARRYLLMPSNPRSAALRP